MLIVNSGDFHSGVQFGSNYSKYFVDLRMTEPVQHLQQFPVSFNGQMTSPIVTSLLNGRSFEGNYKSMVCLNGQNTTGIDAFYWLSDNVIELQQYKANVDTSQNPTSLTQEELDAEYKKAMELWAKHLEPLGIDWVFAMISNRLPQGDLTLPSNVYVVHQLNLEEYYGPTFASLAQVKCM